MKKKYVLLVLALALAFTLPFFVACDTSGTETGNSIQISFNYTTLNMQAGQTQSVFVTTVTPSEYMDYRDQLNWTINNNAVASLARSVGRSVTVTAIAEGMATITVTLPGTDFSQTIPVIVAAAPFIAVTSVTMISPTNPIQVAFTDVAGVQTVTISANVYPSNASNQNVVWSAYPLGIVSLGGSGRTVTVTGTREGVGQTATITVTTECGSFSISRQVIVAELEDDEE
ncbi:MAG: Ig-like domain-containing protein [Firmicutes bacterium]|nr:Ig-like domain-containing protein [Bacillota bacterium]